MPKMLDPFTGHEAQGEMIDEFTMRFQKQGYNKFSKLIDDFNEIMTNSNFRERVNESIESLETNSYSDKEIEKLKKAIDIELSPIIL